MKVTLTNIKKVLSALKVNAASHLVFEEIRKEEYNLIPSGCFYRWDAAAIEAALQENFNCEFVRYKNGVLYAIKVKSK